MYVRLVTQPAITITFGPYSPIATGIVNLLWIYGTGLNHIWMTLRSVLFSHPASDPVFQSSENMQGALVHTLDNKYIIHVNLLLYYCYVRMW